MARTDDDLITLLRSSETDLVERKESLRGQDGTERICQEICAFSNDLPDHRRSGVVFVGATDDGRPSGLAITDRLLQHLADLRDQGRILPPPMVSVRALAVDERQVAVVEVEPSPSPPVRFNGQVWIRVGPRRAIATADEERRLAERRRGADVPFDARIIRSRRCSSSPATRSCTATTTAPPRRSESPGTPTGWRSSHRADRTER